MCVKLNIKLYKVFELLLIVFITENSQRGFVSMGWTRRLLWDPLKKVLPNLLKLSSHVGLYNSLVSDHHY